jgi:diguanylate cyclase (GGDEF)-like protein
LPHDVASVILKFLYKTDERVNMELLLWRWSTAVQLTSLVMIAVFFAALLRSFGRAELKWWVAAWACNFTALATTLVFWAWRPSEAWIPLVKALYMTPKTGFVLLLLHGAWALKRPGERLLRASWAVPAILAYALVAAFLVNGIPLVGVTQTFVMGVLFTMGGTMLLMKPIDFGLAWLSGGFFARALLSFVEAGAYAVQYSAGDSGGTLPTYVSTFLAAHSSFDSGTEWLIALGCVLALSERAQRELRQSNGDLLTAQEDLRRLADKDPLTSLWNRRSLPQIFRAIQHRGATFLFFDLDDFKRVNDIHGHRVGDDCLKRFAEALREHFRPDDNLVRYAGDEFLVIANGLDRQAIDARVDRLRERLMTPPGEGREGPRFSFSVGISVLEPGEDPHRALEEADAAMYREKDAASPLRESAAS